ncbi:hypothetical protein M5X04_03390 [Paenibacillus alvei]|uniref:Uncharacterized protein n=1 Tax=Paenibacillus alvei TaxID=44250 RepID=A0ABT4E5K1_PAEAL|nr:hypothetical protein [Paenibacillus alvei]MCY9528380.1 hypothetical protein [Paenibacillus alvei]
MPYEAKTNWKYDDTVTEKDLNRIEQGLKDAHVAEYKDISLQPGVQIVDVPEDTPFRMGGIRGRTLINLLGRMGKGDSSKSWRGIGVDVISDNGWLKINALSGSEHREHFLEHEDLLPAKAGAFYVVIGLVYAESGGSAFIRPIEFSSDVVTSDYVSMVPTVKVGKKEYTFFTFQTKQDTNSLIVRLQTSPGSTARFGYVSLYEITETEYNAIGRMNIEQVIEAYPYVDGISNVTNPFAMATSRNLLPPFTEWNAGFSGVATEPYTQWVTTAGNRVNSATQTKALEGLTYSLYIERIGDGEIGLDFRDAQNNVIQTSGFVKQNSITATAPQGTVSVNAWTSAPTATPKGYAFRNPMLTIGSVPKPFEPQVRNMLAIESQLAAHPVDGSNADVLYIGDDGLPYILEKWAKVTLDGSLPWEAVVEGTKSGFKILFAANAAPNNASPGDWDDTGKVFSFKYDGKSLSVDDSGVVDWKSSDLVRLFTSNVYISVSNTDSGWGDSYTPTADEIKAYFLGWRMGSPNDWSKPYNGSGEKAWGRIDGKGALISGTGTTSTPTELNAQGDYTPYRLQYLKAKPTSELISNYETGLTFSKGWNMVEVGSGVVIREKANVGPDIYGNFYINHLNVEGTNLAHKTNKIMRAYQGMFESSMWRVYADSRPNGKEYLYTIKENFDPDAVYYVTYTMLDSGLAAPVGGSIAENLCGTVKDVVQWASDVERRLSVVETKKAEKGTPSLVQLTPLNSYTGSTRYPDYLQGLFVRKDSAGYVWLYGLLSGGAPGKAISILPKGFRPKHSLTFAVPFYSERNTDGSGGEATTRIKIAPNGGVFSNTPIKLSAEKGEWISLHLPPFLAEQ